MATRAAAYCRSVEQTVLSTCLGRMCPGLCFVFQVSTQAAAGGNVHSCASLRGDRPVPPSQWVDALSVHPNPPRVNIHEAIFKDSL